MSSKTKIIVLRMKEIIYTGIFLGLAVLLIALCLIMFRPKKDEEKTRVTTFVRRQFTLSASSSVRQHSGACNVRRYVTAYYRILRNTNLV